jgi:hypothetical protein
MKTGLSLFVIITAYCAQIFSSGYEIKTDGIGLIHGLAPTARQNSMMIEPKHRAADYKDAFECLRKEKAQNKVFIKLIDGTVVSNIIEMSLMPNSTVFLLRYNTPKGIKLEAIELEIVHGIGYLE